MDETQSGIPLFVLGLGCLGLAVVWCFVWPKDRTPESLKKQPEYKPRPAWMQSVLRWFHALVWVALAAACWFFAAGQASLASASALIAGLLYLTFVVALVKDGQRRKAFEHESTAASSNRQSDG